MPQTLPNTFSYEYMAHQVENVYRLPGEASGGGLDISLLRVTGAMTPYLSSGIFAKPLRHHFAIPRLVLDGVGWMDLALSEVQSAAVPIAAAEGRVMTAGLGLGYFALAAASKDEVDQVVVYEIDRRVVDWFRGAFAKRPELEKLDIRVGNVREAKPDGRYDSIFMDPYLGMLRDNVIDDIETFGSWVHNIDDYRFWGLEALLLDAVEAQEDPGLLQIERDFFDAWRSSSLQGTEPPGDRAGGENPSLSTSYRPRTTKAYRAQVLQRLERLCTV